MVGARGTALGFFHLPAPLSTSVLPDLVVLAAALAALDEDI